MLSRFIIFIPCQSLVELQLKRSTPTTLPSDQREQIHQKYTQKDLEITAQERQAFL